MAISTMMKKWITEDDDNDADVGRMGNDDEWK